MFAQELCQERGREEEKLFSLRRATRSPEFWLFVVAGIVSTYDVSASIVIPLVMVGLTSASLPKHFELWPKAREDGAEVKWLIRVAMSLASSLFNACAVVGLAHFNRWVWGV